MTALWCYSRYLETQPLCFCSFGLCGNEKGFTTLAKWCTSDVLWWYFAGVLQALSLISRALRLTHQDPLQDFKLNPAKANVYFGKMLHERFQLHLKTKDLDSFTTSLISHLPIPQLDCCCPPVCPLYPPSSLGSILSAFIRQNPAPCMPGRAAAPLSNPTAFIVMVNQQLE